MAQMIPFSNGEFNPQHVAFVGIEQPRAWRKGWAVYVTFSSGGQIREEIEDEDKARARYANVRHQVNQFS